MKTYPYELEQSGIRFAGVFGSWVITYDEIKSVRPVSLWKMLALATNPLKPFLISYLYAGRLGGSIVLVESTTRRVAIIPTDALNFLHFVSERMAACDPKRKVAG